MDDRTVRLALQRHWDASDANDFDVEHEIYREDAVLDSELRVRGIERLRVVDASAMPDLVTAHINACVLMMAEKASDFIRGRPVLEAAQS